MAKDKLTPALEKSIKYNLSIDFYNRVFNQASHAQRLKADWYLVKLAVKCAQKEQAELFCDKFLKEEL